MMERRLSRLRRATSLIRTLVVASATLAILLVCFSMYQYSQVNTAGPPARTRLPSTPSEMAEKFASESPTQLDGGVALGAGGKGRVGPGESVKLTIYSPEGTRARMEIEVDDWTPRPGVVEEFLLTRPRVRLRTNDGNAVRLTADEGIIEAKRRTAGSLDPRRGRLTGHVVIEYDRLNEKQRAALPPERRERIDPSDLVLIELEDMEFDLEYSKVVMPGEVRLTASDARLTTRALEVRFNEAENRVESLRIAGSGTLELVPTSAMLRSSMPGFDACGGQEIHHCQLDSELFARTHGGGRAPGSTARYTRNALRGR
jgi:hypothetical protein